MGGDIWFFSEPLFSAPDARASFLLLRQKKGAKEKATPRYAVGFADYPALLAGLGGCATRGCAPQTVLADFPQPGSVARRCTRGSVKPSASYRQRKKIKPWFSREEALRRLRVNLPWRSIPFGVEFPLGGAEQRSLERGSGRALSEGEARVAQPPLKASSAGNPAAGGAPTRGRLFFGYFLLAKQKKVARRSTAKPGVSNTRSA